MKKALVLLLSAAMMLALLSCGSNPAPTTTTAAPATTDAPTETEGVKEFLDVIPFANTGEIYFDINTGSAIKNFKVTVDGKTIDASGAVPFTADSVLSFAGDADADKALDVYIVMGRDEDGHLQFIHSISNGLDADAAVDRLPSIVGRVIKGSSKVYVAILEKGQNWNRSLSDKLNNFLDQYVIKEEE